jgi:predicted dithiol-disulfide oxidoreductase (DUF899 family)
MEHHRAAEAIMAERQALPMVPVTKAYTFQTPDGPATLKDLFGTKSQLIMYHYMFEPTAEDGCSGCAYMTANFPNLRHLADKDTAVIAVSRAPIEKIMPFKEKNSWGFPWVSSHGSDFNYDYHVTIDEKIAPAEPNFQPKDKLDANTGSGEQPGISVFKLDHEQVYHTYSAYDNLDALTGTYLWLGLTPAGRQEGPAWPSEFQTPAEYKEKIKV